MKPREIIGRKLHEQDMDVPASEDVRVDKTENITTRIFRKSREDIIIQIARDHGEGGGLCILLGREHEFSPSIGEEQVPPPPICFNESESDEFIALFNMMSELLKARNKEK